MKISELFKRKDEYYKTARIRKLGCDPDLLSLFVRELKKSFSNLKNPEKWELDVEKDGEWILLTLSCKAEEEEDDRS